MNDKLQELNAKLQASNAIFKPNKHIKNKKMSCCSSQNSLCKVTEQYGMVECNIVGLIPIFQKNK